MPVPLQSFSAPQIWVRKKLKLSKQREREPTRLTCLSQPQIALTVSVIASSNLAQLGDARAWPYDTGQAVGNYISREGIYFIYDQVDHPLG